MNEKREELMDRSVYMLIGSDVVEVLYDMGMEDLVEDEEKLESLMDFIDSKMEIPWREYVEASIDMYLSRVNLK